MNITRRSRGLLLGLVAILGALILLPGFSCSTSSAFLISGARVTVEPNLESARVMLDFVPEIHSDLLGTYDFSGNGVTYGTFEIDPSTATTPFSMGFRLNLSVLNDQNFLKLDPTDSLPGGQPLPLALSGRKLAKIRLANPISADFNIYAYLDISDAGRQWVGLALMIPAAKVPFLPPGLAVSELLVPDSKGTSQVLVSAFGPPASGPAVPAPMAGIALFANLATLIGVHGHAVALIGQTALHHYVVEGQGAEYYQTHPEALAELREQLIAALNASLTRTNP